MSRRSAEATLSPAKRILLGLIATGVGLGLGALPAYNVFLAHSMKSWKQATGHIARIRPAELGTGGRGAVVRGELSSILTVRYIANGKYLTSDHTISHPVMAGSSVVNEQGRAEDVYVGKRVRCYYNPAMPEWSRLAPPRNEWWHWLPAAGAGFVGISGLATGIVGFIKRRKPAAAEIVLLP